MSPWLGHLALGSLGLALVVVLFRPLFFLWRRRPLASYRLAVVLLAGALLLPLGQLGIERWQAARELGPVRRLAAALELGAEADGSAEPRQDPGLSALTLEELEGLLATLESEEAPLESTAPGTRPPAVAPAAPAAMLWTRARALAARVPGGPAGLLGGLYLAGVALALLRALRRLRRTRALVAAALPITDPHVLSIWRELAAGSPLAGRVRLLASPEVRSPMCFGVERPVVLLPDAPDPSFDPDVLACVLVHELVHLERRDTWVMLGQELLRALFWFHPAAWWLSRRLDFLRELSCDLLVVARTGRRRRYAEALLEYAAWMGRALSAHRPRTTALLSWSGSKSQLSRRIEMLVSLPSQRSFPWTGIPAAISLASCLWGGQLAVAAALTPAQEARQEPAPPAPPEPAHEVAPVPVEPVPAPLAEPRRVLERSPAPEASPEPVTALPPEPPSVAGFQPLAAPPQDAGETPTIGIVLGEVSAERARAIGRPAEGLMAIQGVVPGSRAERAGLRAGDVLATIDGAPATLERLGIAKRRLPAGTIRLGIQRGGSWLEVEVGGQGPDRSAGEALDRLRGLGTAGQASQDARARADAGRQGIQAAREALQRALALNPGDAGVRRALDALQRAQDDGARAHAIQEYQDEYRGQAPRARIEDERALLDQARRLMEQGDLQGAREALERAKAVGAARRRAGEAPRARQQVPERRAPRPSDLQRIYQQERESFLKRQQERGVEGRAQQDAANDMQRRALELERKKKELQEQQGRFKASNPAFQALQASIEKLEHEIQALDELAEVQAGRGGAEAARRSSVEDELRRTEAMVQKHRAEIEALRARIEELRRAQRAGARGPGGAGLRVDPRAPGAVPALPPIPAEPARPGPDRPPGAPGAGPARPGPDGPPGAPGAGPATVRGGPGVGPAGVPGGPGVGPAGVPSRGALPGPAAGARVVTLPPGPVSIGPSLKVRAGIPTPIPVPVPDPVPDGPRRD